MWPWEHVIVGYLCYSLCCRVVYRDTPNGIETLAVAFGSLLPDLVDKPLAWELGVFESGYAVGHSLLVAIPLAIIVGALARSRGWGRTGVAFGVGYLLHPPGDVVDHYARDGIVQPALAFWPVTTVEGGYRTTGFVEQFLHLFTGYRGQLLAGELSTYLWLHVGLAGAAVVVWLLDGAPVLRECTRGSARFVDGVWRRAIE